MQHIYPIVLSFFVTAMCFSFNMKEANFGKQDSLMLVTYYRNTTSASRLQCCSMCLEQEQCRSLSFNKVTYHCVMSDVPSIAVLAFSLGDSQSDVFSKKGNTVTALRMGYLCVFFKAVKVFQFVASAAGLCLHILIEQRCVYKTSSG